jgi:hypothetical protein
MRSASKRPVDIFDWADVVTDPPARKSRLAQIGVGGVLSVLILLSGVNICLRRAILMHGRYALSSVVINGGAAVGWGLVVISMALFLHFHFFWGNTQKLRGASGPAKIGSVLLLIVGLFTFIWLALNP